MDVDIRQVWEEFARDMGGEYHPENLFKSEPYPRVKVSRNSCELTLRASDVPKTPGLKYTSVSGNYPRDDAFEFVVRSGGWFNGLDKLIAKVAGDIEVGFPEFDEPVWVASKSKDKTIAFFADGDLRRKILDLGTCLLAVEKDSSSDGFTISALELKGEIIVEKSRLQQMFDLCWHVFGRLSSKQA